MNIGDHIINKFLSNSQFFRLFTHLIRRRFLYALAHDYACVCAGDSILDIGCGTADIVNYLPDVKYVGFDMNQKYIDFAVKKFGSRGTFFCEKVSRQVIKEGFSFNTVIACAILHHLNDREATELFEVSYAALKTGGDLVTADTCLFSGQSWLVRKIFSMDRGKYIRSQEEYIALASKFFKDIKVSVRHDLYPMPYTVIILNCKK